MLQIYRYARYKHRLDITGQDLISLNGEPVEALKSHIPMLRHASAMWRRLGLVRGLRAMNGEVADEVHEFENVRLGSFKLDRLLVREGRVIELRYRW